MSELNELFESWVDIFSKESERPHVELKESGIDSEYFIEITRR